MGDEAYVAILKDNKIQIESSLEKIRNDLQRYDALPTSEQNKLHSNISSYIRNVGSLLNGMKMDIKLLKNEQSQKAYNDQYSLFKDELRKLESQLKDKRSHNDKMKQLEISAIQLQDMDNNPRSIQKLMDKGDTILNADDEAIDRIDKIIIDDLRIAREVQNEIHKQDQQVNNIQGDLREIDYSLKRAGKQLAIMFKMYATDKIILCMIVIIVLVILAIIITSAVGGDKEGNFNVPHDLFGSKNNTVTGTTATRVLFLK